MSAARPFPCHSGVQKKPTPSASAAPYAPSAARVTVTRSPASTRPHTASYTRSTVKPGLTCWGPGEYPVPGFMARAPGPADSARLGAASSSGDPWAAVIAPSKRIKHSPNNIARAAKPAHRLAAIPSFRDTVHSSSLRPADPTTCGTICRWLLHCLLLCLFRQSAGYHRPNTKQTPTRAGS